MPKNKDFNITFLILRLSILYIFISYLRKDKKKSTPFFKILAKSFYTSFIFSFIFAGYVFFCLLVHLPGWKLIPESDDYLLADLHSHTFRSHDGIISAFNNLKWHYNYGYDIVAITEHNNTIGSEEANILAEQNSSMPLVLKGIELKESEETSEEIEKNLGQSEEGLDETEETSEETEEAFLIGIGDCLNLVKSVKMVRKLNLSQTTKFIDYVKNKDNAKCSTKGAIFTVANKLDIEDVQRLTVEGVDGFEIVNFGHPDMSNEVRREILKEESLHGLKLIASSDWHGWSGYARTWTAISIPKVRKLNRNKWKGLVMSALQKGSENAVIPITAGVIGKPSTLRIVFAPFFEVFRYA